MMDTIVHDVDRHREAIIGLERRLEREEDRGVDTTVACIILMQHYAAFALTMVQQAGGNITELQTLTDRNNCIPLAWNDGRCPLTD